MRLSLAPPGPATSTSSAQRRSTIRLAIAATTTRAGLSDIPTAQLSGGVDLAALTRRAAEEHTLLAAESSLRLDLRLSVGPVVHADLPSRDQALSNLLSNAVRLARLVETSLVQPTAHECEEFFM